ncbi:MAG: hypothetical protein UHH95_05970, partial [Oscillospiraceae bacterium]|nr:hypothetical protein [Oscillospiraceae bacterium]
MKRFADLTHDPQMKTKYEQIAGVNRMFYETLATEDNDTRHKRQIIKETDLIMRAYYLQRALYDSLSGCAVEDIFPDSIDEISDRQTMICRELLTEAKSRIDVINEEP